MASGRADEWSTWVTLWVWAATSFVGGGTDHMMSAGSIGGTKSCEEGFWSSEVPFWNVTRR